MRTRAALLFACGLAAVTAAWIVPPRSRDSTALLMTVWGMPFEDRLFRDGYARDFEAANPGVTVRYEKYADVTDKYLSWHLRGFGADVMRLPVTDYHAMVARGALMPLDGFIEDPVHGLSPESRADFLPWIWNALEIDGAHYAVPADSAQYGLYWNRALFDAHNAAHPDDRVEPPTGDWTWEDLRRAAALLTRRDGEGRVVQYGFDMHLWAWPFMAFQAQAGGRLWDDAGTTTLIADEPGREALELIVELMPHAASMRSADFVESATGPDKLFATGRTAILLDGSWRAPFLELAAPDLDFAIAPLPRHRRAAVVGGSVLWCISAHARRPELAWRMIRDMTSVEGSLRYWDALRVAPPARASVIRSPAFRTTSGLRDDDGTILSPPMPLERWPDRGAWLLHAITPDPVTGEHPGFVPIAPYQKDLEDKIGTALRRAIARSAPTEQLLDEAAGAVHDVIDRDRRAKGLPPVER